MTARAALLAAVSGCKCEPCGHTHGRHTAPLLLASDRYEADAEAEHNLTVQAQQAIAAGRPRLAELLRASRERLHGRQRARRTVRGHLGALHDRLVDALVDIGSTPLGEAAIRQQVAAKNLRWVESLILESDEFGVLASYGSEFDALVTAAVAQAETGGLPAESLRPQSIGRILGTDEQARAAIERVFVLPTQQVLFEGLARTLTGETLAQSAKRIRSQLHKHEGRAATDAVTELAQFDRAVTAVSGAVQGAEYYLYTGPSDGITRDFCGVLLGDGLGMVWATELIAKLDNQQTADSPLTSGGGYNCRHAWAPISEGAARDMDLPFATARDVAAANAAARGA